MNNLTGIPENRWHMGARKEPTLISSNAYIETRHLGTNRFIFGLGIGRVKDPTYPTDVTVQYQACNRLVGSTVLLALSTQPDAFQRDYELAKELRIDVRRRSKTLEQMRHALLDHTSVPEHIAKGVKANMLLLALAHWQSIQENRPDTSIIFENSALVVPILGAYALQVSGQFRSPMLDQIGTQCFAAQTQQ